MPQETRRTFLNATAAGVGSWAVAGSFAALCERVARGERRGSVGYGALRPTADATTGLPLFKLPDGFRYLTFGWTGDPLSDGRPTPPLHDGMAVVATRGSQVILVRNHEIGGHGPPIGTSFATFDPKAKGGCTTLEFDTKAGRFVRASTSLSGTVRNCAGGPTPWGSWLSCEETVLGPGDKDGEITLELRKPHGWIFEVPAGGVTRPRPLTEMGRFYHEAVAVDPVTGVVYETEDRETAGFYRFLPRKPGNLSAGGRLQMMKVVGHPDLRGHAKLPRTVRGQTFGQIEWVDIDEPTRAHSPGTQDTLGVFKQGKARGGTTFARLEGCWYGNQVIYLVATSGGIKQKGQIWQFDPRANRLELIFESPGAEVLDMPDNIAVSPRGGIVLCEDGTVVGHRMHGLTPSGRLFTLVENNIILSGEKNRIKGDFRAQEWAGATFTPDGKWLIANIQDPGLTVAITGPWEDGQL